MTGHNVSECIRYLSDRVTPIFDTYNYTPLYFAHAHEVAEVLCVEIIGYSESIMMYLAIELGLIL